MIETRTDNSQKARRGVVMAFLALGPLAACQPATEIVATGPDPYREGPDGVAIYTGDVRIVNQRLPGTPAPAPAEAPAPRLVSAEDFRSLGDTVTFGADDVTLDDSARQRLTAQAEWLAQNTGWLARVEGHADDPGTMEYNLALGARRAGAVREFLVSQGVDASRISTVSYGRERPQESCTTEACAALNRRVVTTVLPAVGV